MRQQRSIRRKMIVGLWLVLLMLGTLAASSISGVYSYGRLVRDIEEGLVTAPRSSDLTAAIGRLFRPLLLEHPHSGIAQEEADFARDQRAALEQALALVRSGVAEFQAKLNKPPYSANVREQEARVYRSGLLKIDNDLDAIEETLAADDWERRRDDYALQVSKYAQEAFDKAQSLPDPSKELLGRLAQAQINYRWHRSLVWIAGAATLALLLNLVHCAIRWVIRPIRDLHLGARRIAEGDFDYRLSSNTGDEMTELAQDFNQMTERFQAIKSDLDRQVRDRVQQLIRSERLAGLGFLSAGVAHEINNPLSAIAMAAESLEYRLQEWLPLAAADDAAEVRDYLRMMQEEAQRCRQITEKLLDFARGQEGERNLYDVTAIVRDVVGMMRHLGRFRDRKINVHREAPAYAWVNGPEIKQVVLNLVANALESTGADGKLDISITERPDQVELSFTDNGCGMSPDVLKHLFEPFFTTKEVGKGTGLGLSISQRIIRDHDGALEATSAGKGQGSTFRLRLPTTAQTERAVA
ncbi:MAG: HAMP domain-containing histidine kinase [Planctomycetaceae bacterium]|nr:HAMP domain-containing histidine kinase [Planctomycetaceae bacterium]